MRKTSLNLKIMSWHLDFPEFERSHWWKEKTWKWILSRKKVPKSGDGAKQNDELNSAIAWEALRRHPHTRALVTAQSSAASPMMELPDLVQEALRTRPPQMIKVWLSVFGLQSWATLTEDIRGKVRTALLLSCDLSNKDEATVRGDSDKDRSRGNQVRDLFAEALRRVASRHEYKHEPDRAFLRVKSTVVKMTTEELQVAFSKELHRLVDMAWSDGFHLIPIAASPGVSWPRFRDAVRKMYDLHFADADNSRVRAAPLKIIEQFESGKLTRSGAYADTRVKDLRPYRELIEKYSEIYGFPDPLQE